MKKISIFIIALVLLLQTYAQPVNGELVLSNDNLNVLKVWGTSEERAYAYGYLLGHKAADFFVNYAKPVWIGNNYQVMRDMILAGDDLVIDSVYVYEAMSFINGYEDATGNPENIDYIDVLIGNSMEDLLWLINGDHPFQCSSLMSWGDATAGTDLDGKSVISHHFDLTVNPTIIKSHVIVVNFPSEPGLQKWLLVHLAGTLVPIDGLNQHFGVFGQAMDDCMEPVHHGMGYLPYGYASRKAIEYEDYNNDGMHNVLDIRSAYSDCSQGFGNRGLLASMAGTQEHDSLTAMVTEFASNNPTHTFRSNSYPDSIPGDNLYTANYQIARNNAMHFCQRYNSVKAHLGDGTMIGLNENWTIARDWSHTPANIQFKQYAPEADHLKLAIRTSVNTPAYLSPDPYVFSLQELFTQPNVGTKDIVKNDRIIHLNICPNPFRETTNIYFKMQKAAQVKVSVFNNLGQLVDVPVEALFPEGEHTLSWKPGELPEGIYLCRLLSGRSYQTCKMIINK
jgi:hypothetical protein